MIYIQIKRKDNVVKYNCERLEYCNRQIQHRKFVCKKVVSKCIEELANIKHELKREGL